MYFSKSTSGFYEPALHGKKIPSDAVKISAGQYAQLLQDQEEGKVITAGEDGQPISVQPLPTSKEVQAKLIRRQRDLLLKNTDWAMLLDSPITDSEKITAIKNYRAQLRDIPQQKGFPENVTWPKEPF